MIACGSSSTRLVELLLRRRAGVDAQNDNSTTALEVATWDAAAAGHLGTLKLLLDANARTDLCSTPGWTVVECAQANASHSSTPSDKAKHFTEAARLIEQHEHAIQARIQERARQARALAEQQAQQA
eukprot:534580-Prymnesium_polylepis.2